MEREAATTFSKHWLAAWTGNRPDDLLAFYAEDAFYSDPGRRDGVRGHAALRRYFTRLLAHFPDWAWEPEEVIPTDAGFTLKWRATIPFGGEVIVETGLDIVEVCDGKITRNEVYFDRSNLVAAMGRHDAG
jgi:steroid delta-isomerase-like uncharacterized protein